MKELYIGILRETKNPPERRTPLPPASAALLMRKYPFVHLVIQPSEIRAFSNQEYEAVGVLLQEDLQECDFLLGVREPAPNTLLANKSYFFFSHTAKKQEANKQLLRKCIEKKITLHDYEFLYDRDGRRIVSMGYWAGIVGCYNAFRAVGEKYGTFELKPASQCNSVSDLYAALASVYLPKSYKIVMTGGGKVSQAVIDVFQNIGIEKITPQHFLKYRGLEAVFTQLDPWHYSQQKSGEAFDLDHYFRCPSAFESKFAEYGNNADMLITAHYWPAGGPRLLEPADFASGEFSLQIIADISCDLNGPLPSTLRVSTIESPFYGFHKTDAVEVAPFSENAVTVMAIDNLPAEMPRAASEDLGKSLVDVFFPIFLGSSSVRLIENSIICSNGVLSERFGYLQSWLDS
ncbi:MAG: hypothetical protein RIS47_2266 [Bacteroidota bacterium]|jgi:alanine dehydrogenase